MSIHDQFIPGQWVDSIDVNDFVNLNKKPFLKEPIFLEKPSTDTLELASKINAMIKNESTELNSDFSSLSNASAHWIDKKLEKIPGLQNINLDKKIPYHENLNELSSFYTFKELNNSIDSQKTFPQFFDDVATSEIKKAIKMKLFVHAPTNHLSSYLHPDTRKIALYGTKSLIRDRKTYLKSLEKHLQTYEWMQRRIAAQYEIEALKDLEKFCKLYKVNITEPAQSAKEAISFTYLTILASVIESPSISFSLTNLIPFFDIYIEQDLSNDVLNETTAQEMIDEFYLKLSTLRFTLSANYMNKFSSTPSLFGETIGGSYVSKTTYRFLSSVGHFSFPFFSLRVVWDKSLPKAFRQFSEAIINKGVPVTFLNADILDDVKSSVIYHQGLHGVAGDDVVFDGGACDLEKVLYLALNGGKDLSSGNSLLAVTQPIRSNRFEYEEVFTKFKDYLAYVLSFYSEMMNIVSFLNESQNNQPLRAALMNNLMFYHTQFGFFHVEKVVEILYAISLGKFEVLRDKNGWITEIVPQIGSVDDYEVITTSILSFAENELKKIPLYKGGRSRARFYQGEFYEQNLTNPYKKYWKVPLEISKASFEHSLFIKPNEFSISMIENWFSDDFSEIHISTTSSDSIINGVYFKKRS